MTAADPTDRQAPPPPIRLAFIGCGNIQQKHARQLKIIPEAHVAGLYDPDPASIDRLIGRALGEAAEPPTPFTDLDRLYEQAQPDAVVIASPHTLHYRQCVEALDRGCHVLVEKPMVTDLDEARDLERRVEASGKVLCIAYNTPCSVEFATLRHYVRQKPLGELRVVAMSVSQPWQDATRGSWRQDPALSGGGMLYDTGAHVLNSLTWTVEDDVDEVFARVDNCGCPVDINGTVNVRFAGGVLATVAVSGQAASSSHASFMFDGGRFDIDPWGGKWMTIDANLGGRIKYPRTHGADSQPIANFLDAIQGRDEPRTTVRHGVLQSQLMDAIYESARTGGPAKPA